MKKITVFRRISFIDVDLKAISPQAKYLLATYLMGYIDANPVLGDHLYYLEDAIAMLKDNNLPAETEGVQEIASLQALCLKKKAAYIRLVIE